MHWQDQRNTTSADHLDRKVMNLCIIYIKKTADNNIHIIYLMQDIDIIVTYSDPSGTIRVKTIRSRDLSASWVWKNPGEENRDQA